MRSTSFRLALVLSIAFLGSSPTAAPQATTAPAVAAFQVSGPLTFGADGVLSAGDAQGATINPTRPAGRPPPGGLRRWRASRQPPWRPRRSSPWRRGTP